MGPSSGAVVRALLARPRGRLLRHLLFALSLVVVVLSIVGMHQLSLGHDVAVGPAPVAYVSVAQAKSAARVLSGGEVLPVAMAALPSGHDASGMTDGAMGGACPDCDHHQMALGSCLLALTLLVLGWLLAPPRPTHVLPFLLPNLVLWAAVSATGRLVPPLSLAELSLLRT